MRRTGGRPWAFLVSQFGAGASELRFGPVKDRDADPERLWSLWSHSARSKYLDTSNSEWKRILKNLNADGLRGLAALNVVISHFVAAFLPTALYYNYPSVFAQDATPSLGMSLMTTPLATLTFNGHFPVVLFFVLSGYVLTIPHFNGNIDAIRRRLWGRYFRLNVPIFAAIMFSFIIYHYGLYSNLKASTISGSTWLEVYFKPGYSLIDALESGLYGSIFHGDGSFVPPLWTLKIEFIGSLYLLSFYVIKPRDQLIVPALLFVLFLLFMHGGEALYYFAILAGSFINLLKLTPSIARLFCLIGLFFGAFQFHSMAYGVLPSASWFGLHHEIDKTVYNLVGALFLTAGVVNGAGSTLLQSRPIQFLGKISFSLYIIHFSILCSMSCSLYLLLPEGTLSLLTIFTFYILSCMILSLAFHATFDRPSIKLSHSLSSVLAGTR